MTLPITVPGAEITPLNKLKGEELEARITSDIHQIEVERKGLREVIEYLGKQREIFPRERPKQPRLLRREEKERLWAAWQRFLDYSITLDSLEDYHRHFARLKGAARDDSLLIGTAAMYTGYRAALEFISQAEVNSELHKVLNDPVPELGLPGGTYAKLKFKYLNLAIATQFTAREVLLKTVSGERRKELRAMIQQDADFLWKGAGGRGHVLTAKNALKVIQDTASAGWLPIQTGVSEWMGHTKVYRLNQPLITLKQIRQMQSRLLPGDIVLERREWYLSNIGLPGFWSHAALYIGTPEERRAFFADDATKAWVQTQDKSAADFEDLLRMRFAEKYQRMLDHRDAPVYPNQSDPAPDPVRIIEAISEGVSFHSLEHSAACDSLVVLRPRLPNPERAQALFRAFAYVGRPYDFDFDFSTDAKLVCTELIYKCYEPAAGLKGLRFPTVEMLGRQVTPANEFVKQFDQQFCDKQQQTDMVLFLDGREAQKKAVEGTVEEFRKSWARPKWHVWLQPPP